MENVSAPPPQEVSETEQAPPPQVETVEPTFQTTSQDPPAEPSTVEAPPNDTPEAEGDRDNRKRVAAGTIAGNPARKKWRGKQRELLDILHFYIYTIRIK